MIGNKSVVQLVSITFLGRVAGRILKYLFIVIIARGLGDSTLGLFATGFVVIKFGTTLSNLGIDNAMRKYIPVYRSNNQGGKISGLVVTGLTLSVVGGLIVAFLASFVLIRTQILPRVDKQGLVVFLIGIPFLSVAKSLDATTLGYDRTRFSVYIRDIGQEGFSVIFVSLAIVLFGTERAAIAGYVLSLAGTACISVLAVYRLGGFSGLGEISVDMAEIARYSVITTFSALAQKIVLWSDIIVLGIFVSQGLVGRYQAAYQTSALLLFALVATNSIFPSLASRFYSNNKDRKLENLFNSLIKWVASLTWAGVIYTVVLADEILLIFGTNFQNAIQTLTVLAIAQGVVASVGPAGYLLLMTGKEKIEILGKFITAITNIGLNFLLIPKFGILGAALATGLSLALLNLFRAAVIQYSYGYYPGRSTLLIPVIPTVATGIISQTVNLMPLGPVVTLATAGIGCALTLPLVFAKVVYGKSDKILIEGF